MTHFELFLEEAYGPKGTKTQEIIRTKWTITVKTL